MTLVYLDKIIEDIAKEKNRKNFKTINKTKKWQNKYLSI